MSEKKPNTKLSPVYPPDKRPPPEGHVQDSVYTTEKVVHVVKAMVEELAKPGEGPGTAELILQLLESVVEKLGEMDNKLNGLTLQMGDVESRLDALKPASGRQTAAAASKTSSSASKH